MLKARKKIALALSMAWLLFAGPIASAQGITGNGNPAWFVELEKKMHALWDRPANAHDVVFVWGNELWLPGNAYRNGTDWFALVCEKGACRFDPARLRVKAEQWQGHYDDTATDGQKLVFDRTRPGRGLVKAWFQRHKDHAWIKQGPLVSYPWVYRKDTPSTAELTIRPPSGPSLHLVPVLKKSSFYLQLRTNTQRQMLYGTLFGCTSSVNRDYLVWAGDLDGDGRADLLVSFAEDGGPVHLYLSSRATEGEMVGVGGVVETTPNEGECDGPEMTVPIAR